MLDIFNIKLLNILNITATLNMKLIKNPSKWIFLKLIYSTMAWHTLNTRLGLNVFVVVAQKMNTNQTELLECECLCDSVRIKFISGVC